MQLPSVLRTVGTITLAVVAGAVVFVLIAIMTAQLTAMGNTPADFLPAQQTAALLTAPMEEDVRLLEPLFPALADVPKDCDAVALFHDGSTAIFSSLSTTRRNADALTMGRYAVVLSQPENAHFFQTQNTVSALNAYRALARLQQRNTPWIFLKTDVLPASQTIMEELFALLHPPQQTYVSVLRRGDDVQISWFGEQRPATHSLPATVHTASTGSALLLRIADVQTLYSHIETHASEETRSALFGAINGLLEKTFGKEIQLRYGILPLLSGPTTLNIGTTASGAFFTMESVGNNRQNVEETLTNLHAAFRSAHPATHVVTRTLDHRFTSKDIRMGEMQTEELLLQKTEQWKILLTTRGDGIQFVTAQRGGTFVMGNDIRAVTDALQPKDTVVSPVLSGLIPGTRFADGWIDTELWAPITQKYAPFLNVEGFAPLLPQLSRTLMWSMESSAQTTTLSVRAASSENSPVNR